MSVHRRILKIGVFLCAILLINYFTPVDEKINISEIRVARNEQIKITQFNSTIGEPGGW